MFPSSSDPLTPVTSRFPLRPAGGRVPIESCTPSASRPFGMQFAQAPPVREAAKHDRKQTRVNKTRPTRHTTDGKERKTIPDTENYVELVWD